MDYLAIKKNKWDFIIGSKIDSARSPHTEWKNHTQSDTTCFPLQVRAKIKKKKPKKQEKWHFVSIGIGNFNF